MATAGMRLVHGLEPADLADDLDRLYCYEQVTIHWARAVENRLTGLAAFVLGEPLREHVTLAEGHAQRLADRIAQLGGGITPDPTHFLGRSQLATVEMPDDTSDPSGVFRYALAQEQRAIDSYGQLLDRTRGLDAVTEQLLTSILADKVAQEDEIEAAVTPLSRGPDTNPPHERGKR
jgi:ferritin-like protein